MSALFIARELWIVVAAVLAIVALVNWWRK
jgi:hypothetical protein